MHETGAQGFEDRQVLREDPEGWDCGGGGRRDQDGEHM